MPASTPTLRDMIQEAVDPARGQTYDQLAAKAVDAQTGKRVSRAMLNNIVLRKVDRMPYEHHLRAIAAALGKPYEVVFHAALRQWFPGATANAAEPSTSALLTEARRLTEAALTEARRLTEAAERQAGESSGERESA